MDRSPVWYTTGQRVQDEAGGRQGLAARQSILCRIAITRRPEHLRLLSGIVPRKESRRDN